MASPSIMQSTRISFVVTCAGLVLATHSQLARAEEPAASDVAAARGLGQEGIKLADAGNCPEAIDRLQRAEKLFHAPTTLARLGECQILTGKIVEGTENLNRVIREPLAATAPAPFLSAQERAKTLYAEAKPKIAMLKIAVAAPAGVEPVVTIDGEPVPSANLNTNRPTNPGMHTVEAGAPGFKKSSAKVTLTEGGTDSIALTLEVDPNAPKPEPASTTTPAQPPPKGEPVKAKASLVPPLVAFGVGAAGLAVGTLFGAMALGEKGQLDDLCPTKTTCQPAASDRIDTGKTYGTVSTIGFVVGGVGVVAGAVMLATGWPKTSTKSSARRGIHIEPRVGLGSIAFGGTF